MTGQVDVDAIWALKTRNWEDMAKKGLSIDPVPSLGTALKMGRVGQDGLAVLE